MSGLLRNPGKKLTRNDAFDWFHTIVRVAYCHAVLLDGRWATQVDIVRTAIVDAGSTARMAAIFSGSDDGVERFLREIESAAQPAATP